MKWFERLPEGMPFSFVYGGRRSADLLENSEWALDRDQHIDGGRVRSLVSQFGAGLRVECVVTEYDDFPATEWILYLENDSSIDSEILEDVRALDIGLECADSFKLHTLRGSQTAMCDFSPTDEILLPNNRKKISTVGGRSSCGANTERNDGVCPFFNVIFGDGGIIFAVGWSGQWEAQFERDGDKGLRVTAGMEHLRTVLRPAERIRTPRMLVFSWKGDRAFAHNEFRRLILAHHTPQIDGKPVELPLAASTWDKYGWGNKTDEQNQIHEIDMIASRDLGVECYWVDAGWYEGENWAFSVGNWFPKKHAYPNGMKPVVDAAKKHGWGFVLWFEPERVYPGTWLHINHPEWLIPPSPKAIEQRTKCGMPEVESLLDLGNASARRWLTDHISSIIEETGITVYRQDVNFDVLEYWLGADQPDRTGITEIRYIEGLYAFWDELLERHPSLMIDNCASGGRRLDLESISRSVALWRTDFAGQAESTQCHTLGINLYMPVSGSACVTADTYWFRSTVCAGLVMSWDVGFLTCDKLDADALRARLEEFKILRPLFYGDFYPLTEHSVSGEVWCAYQLHNRETGSGAVLAFRRENSPYGSATLKLMGLEADKTYGCTDRDTGVEKTIQGRELLELGLEVVLPEARSSFLMLYSPCEAAR